MQQSPRISIITPAFNCAGMLTETIRSVRTQSFEDWEHIVVDDASSDQTCAVVEEIAARDGRVKLLRQERNEGPGAARNRGIEAASGRYIAFIDSDDLWFPQKLERQLAFMERTGTVLSYTNYDKISEDGTRVVGHVQSPVSIDRSDLLRSNQIACSTAMYDTAAAGRVYMPSIRKRQDWGLWLRLARAGFTAVNVGETLVRYRVRTNSVSSNKFNAMVYTWRFYRQVVELSVPEALVRTVAYAAINLRKYARARRVVGAPAEE